MSRQHIFGLNLLLIAALLAAPLRFADFRSSQSREEKKQKTELHKKMETIDDGMKKLKRHAQEGGPERDLAQDH